MRFIHTSDWHLGRIFHGVHLTDDQAYVLEQLIYLVRDAGADAVLVSGDIYDRAVPPTEAVKLLDEVLSRLLLDCRVPVLMIAGNHDSPERLGFGTRLLARQGLHLRGQLSAGAKPVVLEDDHGPVYFCLLPYADPPLVREKLAAPNTLDHQQAMNLLIDHMLGQVPGGVRTVAVAHAFVAGGLESESERPLSVGGAGTVDGACFRRFHYAALGHLHSAQRAGSDHVRYAGSLMKYSFAEAAGQKTVTLVDLGPGGEVSTEQIALSPRRDLRRLEGYLDELLAGARHTGNNDDYLMVTLKDTGAILDPIGKLRAVYPNVLHIERPCFSGAGVLEGPGRDYRRISEADLFASFFQQVTGEELSGELHGALVRALDAFYRREREVQA